jgi:hypothetical protein
MSGRNLPSAANILNGAVLQVDAARGALDGKTLAFARVDRAVFRQDAVLQRIGIEVADDRVLPIGGRHSVAT